MSKQFTVVTTVKGLVALNWVLQFVGGSDSRLPKYLISYAPAGGVEGGGPENVTLYSPLIATSPGRHNAVELANEFSPIVDEFPIIE